MRCLALAGGLREAGARCAFVSRGHQGHLLRRIEAEGFPVHALREPATGGHGFGPGLPVHAAWLGADSDDDARETLAAIGGKRFDWLVVDHYAIDVRWERQLRGSTHRMLAIDDLADRDHDCDLLLDQGPGRVPGEYSGRVPAGAGLLVGPRFALLRPEFAGLRAAAEQRPRRTARRLLVTLGGVDSGDITSAVLRGLAGCKLPAGFTTTIIMGAWAPWLEKVRAAAAALPCSAEVRVDVPDMARVMLDSDLAIGAAGTTALERCCLGLPAIAIVLAENQRSGAHGLARSGAVLLADEVATIESQVSPLLQAMMDEGRLATMSAAALAVTGGLGVAATVEQMRHAS